MLAVRVTESNVAAIATRKSARLHGTAGLAVGSQSPAPAPKIELRIGKNRAFPAGTVQLRVTMEPPTNVPAKKKTGPVCCRAQFAPVVSKFGSLAAGIESNHCHH